MKKTYCTVLFLLSFNLLNAQFIIAGQHGPGDYFFDQVPDQTLTAPHNAAPPIYTIDINGDMVNDFQLIPSNYGGLGGGSTGSSLYISGTFTQVAYDINDTCFNFQQSVQYIRRMPKSFALSDTIGANEQWDTCWTFAFSHFIMGNYSCSGNAFIDSSDQYLGVRTLTQTDTLYGWVKMSNVYAGSFIVEEYAGNYASVNVPSPERVQFTIYPNPFDGNLFYKGITAPFRMRIFNIHGVLVSDEIITLDSISPMLVSGLYFYEISSENAVHSGKLIKF